MELHSMIWGSSLKSEPIVWTRRKADKHLSADEKTWWAPSSLAMRGLWCLGALSFDSLTPFLGSPQSCLSAVTTLSLNQQGGSWQAYLLQLLGKPLTGCQTKITKLILPITSLAGDHTREAPFPPPTPMQTSPLPPCRHPHFPGRAHPQRHRAP